MGSGSFDLEAVGVGSQTGRRRPGGDLDVVGASGSCGQVDDFGVVDDGRVDGGERRVVDGEVEVRVGVGGVRHGPFQGDVDVARGDDFELEPVGFADGDVTCAVATDGGSGGGADGHERGAGGAVVAGGFVGVVAGALVVGTADGRVDAVVDADRGGGGGAVGVDHAADTDEGVGVAGGACCIEVTVGAGGALSGRGGVGQGVGHGFEAGAEGLRVVGEHDEVVGSWCGHTDREGFVAAGCGAGFDDVEVAVDEVDVEVGVSGCRKGDGDVGGFGQFDLEPVGFAAGRALADAAVEGASGEDFCGRGAVVFFVGVVVGAF